MRIVIDTNQYISYFLGKNTRDKIDKIFSNRNIIIIVDEHILVEIIEVTRRPKFNGKIDFENVKKFIKILENRSQYVHIHSIINQSPDPKDNFLLCLSKDGNADYLVTGDKPGLLNIGKFENTEIITMTNFVNLI